MLFSTLAEMAETKGLTAEQFDLFREAMFVRVFTTVPSVFELGRQAMLRGDREAAATAIRNLMEEGGEGIAALMHPKMMEEAFNVVAKEVFGLPPVTMQECYERSTMQEALIYRATVRDFYEKQGPAVSYAQEFASGGNNSPSNPGMMGNMYKLFHHYRHAMPEGVFEAHVLPYFAAHISVDSKSYEQVFDANGIEFQHGQRALGDVLRYVQTKEDVQCVIGYMRAFLKVQSDFFDKVLEDIQTAKTQGIPVIERLSEEAAKAANVVPLHIVREGNHIARVEEKSCPRERAIG
jgi:hypothetical protein